jgi:hypothetical protein
VRLADERRRKALGRELRRQRLGGRLVRQIDAVADHAMGARVAAGEHGGARRLAERILRAALPEERAFRGEAIETRRRAHRIAVGPDGRGFVLIGGDQQDVHRRRPDETSTGRARKPRAIQSANAGAPIEDASTNAGGSRAVDRRMT